MNIKDYSKKLRELTLARANYKISLATYRHQRKCLLDALDKNFNGIEPNQITEGQVKQIDMREQRDKTQPYLAAKIDQCMNFLKGSNGS